jgi:hypothetical protein
MLHQGTKYFGGGRQSVVGSRLKTTKIPFLSTI